MKIKEIAKQLANKINQEHYVMQYLDKIQRGAYNKGFKDAESKKLVITDVGNWVAIESTEQPEKCTEVVVIYKDGRKAVALFDGDGRFYIEKDDWDITNMIAKWHRLP